MTEEIKSKRKNKKKNPLYVVTGEGKTVEEAANVLDVLVKKLGLEGLVAFLKQMIEILGENIKSYAAFEFVLGLITKLNESIEKMSDVATAWTDPLKKQIRHYDPLRILKALKIS
jgi:hypothetical protein